MFKQFLVMVAASVAAIFLKDQLIQALGLLVTLHNQIAMGLASVFAGDSTGQIIRGTIALIAIPVVLGGVLSIAWWLARKTVVPYLYPIVWIVWVILLVTLLAQAG